MPPLQIDSTPFNPSQVIGQSKKKEILEVNFDNNVTPLYDAISNSDWDGAERALRCKPIEARTWVVRYGNEGEVLWRFLPIHSACARQPPHRLIDSLIRAYPEGTRELDDQGMFPLHYACGNQASTEVTDLLINSNPDAITTYCKVNGMLPIHYLAQWGPSHTKVIELMLTVNREILDMNDQEGNSTFDLAYEGDYPERDEVTSVLERFAAINKDDCKTNEFLPKTTMQEINRAPELTKLSKIKTIGSAFTVHKQSHTLESREMDLNEEKHTECRQQPVAEEKKVPEAVSVMKEIASLKAEVNKLRAEAAIKEAETDEVYNKEKDAADSAAANLKLRIDRAHGEIENLREKVKHVDNLASNSETILAEKDNEFAQNQRYANQLKRDIAIQMETINSYENKNQLLEERMETLRKTMETMTNDQNLIMRAMEKQQEHFRTMSETRQKKLQELIDQEVSVEKEGMQKMQSRSGDTITHQAESQRDIMNHVLAQLN